MGSVLENLAFRVEEGERVLMIWLWDIGCRNITKYIMVYRYSKRIFDMICALIGIVGTSPVWLFSSVAT